MKKEKHGASKHGAVLSEYSIWSAMKSRCYNPKAYAYERYGGRGIIVCERWLHSFSNFLKDMGSKPSPKHSIDRIKNDGNYEPSNCRWATQTEQCENKSTNRLLTYNGETRTIKAWAKHCNISVGGLEWRLENLGWSVEKAIETPLDELKTDKVNTKQREWYNKHKTEVAYRRKLKIDSSKIL